MLKCHDLVLELLVLRLEVGDFGSELLNLLREVVFSCICGRLLIHLLQVFDLLFEVLCRLIPFELEVIFLQLKLLERRLQLLKFGLQSLNLFLIFKSCQLDLLFFVLK